MANKFKLESAEERAERMVLDNPGKPKELCLAVVEANWEKRREGIDAKIPERFSFAEIEDLGFEMTDIIAAVSEMLVPVGGNDKTGVVLLGPAGVGKTYAFYAIIRRLAEKNPEMIAYITTYSEMMTELKSEFVGNSYNEMGSVWDKLNNDSGLYNGILFIDDVSAQKLTDFEVDKMMMFLDKRVNSFSPFVITTNVPLEDFKKVFGDRLASRILGYSTVVEFIGGDNRTKV